MRSKGKPEELERIRFKAVLAVTEGIPQREVAKVLGVDRTTVSKWFNKYLEDPDSLKAKPIRGRTPRLSTDQMQRLAKLLLKGPGAFGWRTDVWTCPRVAELIQKEFQISFHPDHVLRILTRKMGFSFQKPEKVARERNPEAVAQWVRTELPDIKKKPSRKRRR